MFCVQPGIPVDLGKVELEKTPILVLSDHKKKPPKRQGLAFAARTFHKAISAIAYQLHNCSILAGKNFHWKNAVNVLDIVGLVHHSLDCRIFLIR
jgi:hypothetical protein